MTVNQDAVQRIEHMFMQRFRPLTVYAMQYVKDRSAAEDIVQDLFLYVYDKFCETNKEIPADYLYTLVRFRCLNELVHQRTMEKSRPDIEKTYSNPHDPLELIEIIELEHSYLQAIESLPSKCRQVFRMSRILGKNNRQISEELSLSKRTVESHITHALAAIREKLSEHLVPTLLFLILFEQIFTYGSLFNCYTL